MLELKVRFELTWDKPLAYKASAVVRCATEAFISFSLDYIYIITEFSEKIKL